MADLKEVLGCSEQGSTGHFSIESDRKSLTGKKFLRIIKKIPRIPAQKCFELVDTVRFQNCGTVRGSIPIMFHGNIYCGVTLMGISTNI